MEKYEGPIRAGMIFEDTLTSRHAYPVRGPLVPEGANVFNIRCKDSDVRHSYHVDAIRSHCRPVRHDDKPVDEMVNQPAILESSRLPLVEPGAPEQFVPVSAVRPCMTCGLAPINYARLGPYRPRADICEECISLKMRGFTRSETDVQRETNDRLAQWEMGLHRLMMDIPAPGRTLIVGGMIAARPEGMTAHDRTRKMRPLD